MKEKPILCLEQRQAEAFLLCEKFLLKLKEELDIHDICILLNHPSDVRKTLIITDLPKRILKRRFEIQAHFLDEVVSSFENPTNQSI